MKNPKNETCLAAELQSVRKKSANGSPFQAAVLAMRLCAIGRSYKRLAERLCGGEEEWGRHPEAQCRIEAAEKRLEALEAKARSLLAESPFDAKLFAVSLHLAVQCGYETTALI